jgi:hypothetical protein
MPATLQSPNPDLFNYPNANGQAAAQIITQGANQFLELPITFALADGAVLYTHPLTSPRIAVGKTYHEVTTPWTGGTTPAVGLSSSNASYNTKGDLLGGASGDVAGSLGLGFKGTVGAKASGNAPIVLNPGDTIRLDRVAGAGTWFTAGASLIHLHVAYLPTS